MSRPGSRCRRVAGHSSLKELSPRQARNLSRSTSPGLSRMGDARGDALKVGELESTTATSVVVDNLAIQGGPTTPVCLDLGQLRHEIVLQTQEAVDEAAERESSLGAME